MTESVKVAVITGAGSGIGRAAAHRLASDGFRVALIGRDESKLSETANAIRTANGVTQTDASKCIVCPGDIANEADVQKLVTSVLETFGRVDVLVNAAGMNVPKRSIMDCSAEDYARVVSVNLSGAFLLTKGFLATMRAQNAATIINIVSDSGLRGNNFAGAAYISSKFGLKGFTESINAEERHNGIRATAIYPGEVNTPILDKRPQPPSAELRAKMLQPDDIADCVSLVASLPQRAIVEEMVVRPAVQDWISRR